MSVVILSAWHGAGRYLLFYMMNVQHNWGHMTSACIWPSQQENITKKRKKQIQILFALSGVVVIFMV